MKKFYIYYNEDTQQKFCTAYEWSAEDDTVRRYCQHVGNRRYTHQDIQLDIVARILTDKRNNNKYALIEPRNLKPNLRWETVEMQTPVEWAD